jgi:hypothetical protein
MGDARRGRYWLVMAPVRLVFRFDAAELQDLSKAPCGCEAEIESTVDRLGDLVRVLADANPNDKSEVFRQLGGLETVNRALSAESGRCAGRHTLARLDARNQAHSAWADAERLALLPLGRAG